MTRPHLSPWSLRLAISMIAGSVVLALMVLQKRGTDVMLPYALVGYVLTPFGVAAALVWARSQDLSLQGNPLYYRLDGQARIKMLGLLVALSFIPAFVHIYNIASFIRSWYS